MLQRFVPVNLADTADYVNENFRPRRAVSTVVGARTFLSVRQKANLMMSPVRLLDPPKGNRPIGSNKVSEAAEERLLIHSQLIWLSGQFPV
jgi:hypothetical protein